MAISGLIHDVIANLCHISVVIVRFASFVRDIEKGVVGWCSGFRVNGVMELVKIDDGFATDFDLKTDQLGISDQLLRKFIFPSKFLLGYR